MHIKKVSVVTGRIRPFALQTRAHASLDLMGGVGGLAGVQIAVSWLCLLVYRLVDSLIWVGVLLLRLHIRRFRGFREWENWRIENGTRKTCGSINSCVCGPSVSCSVLGSCRFLHAHFHLVVPTNDDITINTNHRLQKSFPSSLK